MTKPTLKPSLTLPAGIWGAGKSIVALAAVLGAFWTIDSHYASAGDLVQLQNSVEKSVTQMQRSMETQVRTLRRERNEDELSKLDSKKIQQKGKLSVEDTLTRERYLRQIDETAKEQRSADAKK